MINKRKCNVICSEECHHNKYHEKKGVCDLKGCSISKISKCIPANSNLTNIIKDGKVIHEYKEKGNVNV